MGKTIKKEQATKAGLEASCSGTRSKPKQYSEKIGNYRKRSIIQILKANNCNPNLPEALSKQCDKVPFENIKSEYSGNKFSRIKITVSYNCLCLCLCLSEFIEEESNRCQNLVRSQYFHQDFEEANNLVEKLEAKNCKATCSYDVSLVLQTIAHTEDHPAPSDIGDIDLKYSNPTRMF